LGGGFVVHPSYRVVRRIDWKIKNGGIGMEMTREEAIRNYIKHRDLLAVTGSILCISI